ncbi:MAG: phage holin family protein [Muribaculaceae bacterium]|nr:phage holin family protein [Muribaculaceae bacterium]
MAILTKNSNYKWEFENIGGSTRVRIETGEDIAHLSELDPKMWTVLSCPINGLEIDDKSLAYIDSDKDGKIRVNDIVSTSNWIINAIKDVDLILKGDDFFDINKFDTETVEGKKLYDAAKQILKNLNKEGDTITISDTTDIAAIFAKTRFNGDGVITENTTDNVEEKNVIASIIATIGGVADRSGEQGVNTEKIETFYKLLSDYIAWIDSSVDAPYGDKTDKVIDAYNAVDAKVKDFFMRSKLASFSPDSISALDVQTSRIESISADNLTEKLDEIASYPIARVTGVGEINLEDAINPAWASYFETLKSAVFVGKKKITESDWIAIKDTFSAYIQWKNSKIGAEVESLGVDTIKKFIDDNNKEALLVLVAEDSALKEEAENIVMVDKFFHIYRDFYRLLRNFITLHDFYTKDSSVKAIFQSGRLIVDQRECRFCMKVADMAKHNTMAASSGMFLVYCDCVAKDKPAKLSIVAAVTVGSIGDLVVGKNAIYYDNEGGEWDAVITKIIDNPISISQAFWSPYRRIATVVENLINKSAAEKDAKVMSDATAKINSAQTTMQESSANPDATKAATPPFDIAKFAGIFAAIGMALGMIGTALVAVFEGLAELSWWKLILVFVGIMLAISGPSMILAWMKLRRRNIAPLLNANGWAVNASSKISIPFGETLTDSAKFPKLKLQDPYKKAGIPTWKKWMITIIILAIVFIGLWLFNLLSFANLKSPLPRYNQVEIVEEVVTEEVLNNDSITVLENESTVTE